MFASLNNSLQGTTRHINDIVKALLEAAYDREKTVRDIIGTSLFELGQKEPCLILQASLGFLQEHTKLPLGHRVVILNVIGRICKQCLEHIEKDLAMDIIKQSISEMTRNKEVSPEWQTAASSVLVEISAKFCNEVMAELMLKFQPGVLPHFFVVQTMANMASVNAYGLVPFLHVVLSQMLHMMGMAKQENMRWVFSHALSKFCEAILDYEANIEKAPDTSVKRDRYSADVFAAFEILNNVWSQTKETKLRVAIVEAIGNMAPIMSQNKLEEQLPKLLQGLLGLYKKQMEAFYVTQGLSMVLEAATANQSRSMEPHLEMLLNSLFPQVCQPHDYANPMTVKNHNELLRCFAVLAASDPDRVLDFLRIKMEPPGDRTRIGALAILRHLINSSGERLEEKHAKIISGLRAVLTEPSNKVRKSLAQTLLAMAHHGYLQEEGGHDMLQFVVRQCAIIPEQSKRRPTDPELVTDESLRSMCENVLWLMTTTVEGIEQVLWPEMLEFVVPLEYTESVGCVCRSIAHTAGLKRENNAEDLILDYDRLVNLPKPLSLIARLMVMGGRAVEGRNRGVHVLTAMKALSPTLHESLVELWDAVIPKLLQYLQDAVEDESKWSQKNWEDLVLKLLSKSLDVVEDEDWLAELGQTFAEQIPLYENLPLEKNFLFKCLGIVLRKTTKKDFVVKYLDVLFDSVKHSSQTERQGCAIAMGFTAASHLDAVLTKLDSISRNSASPRRSSGIFSFFKDNQDIDERVKCTFVLSCGYVTLYAPQTLIVSRVETSIMKIILPHYVNVKDLVLKQNLIECADLIGRAMHPSHLQTDYKFKHSADLRTHMQNYIRAEIGNPVLTDIRTQAIDACTTLIKPEVLLTHEETKELVSITMEAVMSLPTGTNDKKKPESADQQERNEQIHDEVLQATHKLFGEILRKDKTLNSLEAMFQEIYPNTLREDNSIRLRAVQLLLQLLQSFKENINIGIGRAPSFTYLGSTLGSLVPRCSDPEMDIRQAAIECSYVLLCIELKYQGYNTSEHDEMVSALQTLKERAKRSDANVLFSVIKDLAKVLCRKVPANQLTDFVKQLMAGLLDSMSHSSSGACLVLGTTFKERGPELAQMLPDLLTSLHLQLGQITNTQTKTGTLRALRTLIGHHLMTSLEMLLKYPLPLDPCLVDIWQTVAQDRALTKSVVDNLVELMSRHMPYNEKPDPSDRENNKTLKVATFSPLAATCALTEIMYVEDSEKVVCEQSARLMAILMVRLASTVGAAPPPVLMEQSSKNKNSKKSRTKSVDSGLDPCKLTVTAFQQLVSRAQLHVLNDTLTSKDTWSKFESEEEYPDAFSELARALVEVQPGLIARVTSHIMPVLSGVYDCQRIMAAAFLSELVGQKCAGDMTLVDMIINTLLGRLVDQNATVRKLCIRGLGNIACTGSEQIQKYSTTVLSAMMAGMDDKEDLEDEITLEAMSGLTKILAEIDESHIRSILINIALRIRPCFEKEQGEVRAAAVELFGNLSRFANGPSEAPFMEQVHSNLVSLLLHLNDAEADVKKACKSALQKLGPLLGSDDVNQMFQNYLKPELSLHYGEFMNDLSKVLIKDFEEKLNFYCMGCVTFFKSLNEEIRSSATMFLGFLLGNMPVENYPQLSKEHVCSALILLLKDSSAEVRLKAAEAMSRLYQF